jgi:hypothetical protein
LRPAFPGRSAGNPEIAFRRMASHANFPVQRHSELGGFLIE